MTDEQKALAVFEAMRQTCVECGRECGRDGRYYSRHETRGLSCFHCTMKQTHDPDFWRGRRVVKP